MQTMPQFLSKILDLVDRLKKEGKNPQVLYLNSEDERTLTVQLWQEQLKVGNIVARMHAPPNIRAVLQGGDLFCGMFVQWDAPFNRTSVRPLRAAEAQVLQEHPHATCFTDEMAARAAALRAREMVGKIEETVQNAANLEQSPRDN